MNTVRVQVPATSANCGPGFDCLGLALNLYNIFSFTPDVNATEYTYTFEGPGADILRAEDPKKNLTGFAMDQVFATAQEPIQYGHITSETLIPPSRGLGSSSTAQVGGLLLANALVKHPLSKEELLVIANRMEGHPDNVAPAIYGNLTISSYLNEKVSTVVTEFPEVSFIAYVPNYELRTKDSRGVLPKGLSYREAVTASSVANVAIAALMKGDMVIAGRAIESDRFREHYRQGLIKEFPKIKMLAKKNGAYATYLSGAGPTVMVLAPKEQSNMLKDKIEEQQFKGQVFELQVDCQGVRVEK